MTAIAYAALWFFVFSVPWENIVVIRGVGAISRLMGIVAIGFVCLTVVLAGRMRRWHAVHIAALLFLLWAGFGQLFFHSGDKLSNKFWTYAQLVLVLWMIWELAPSRARQIGLLLAYVLGAYVAAFDTIIQYRHHAEGMRRFAAEGFDPNDLAMILALAIPMAWYLAMTYRRPLLRWICRGYLPVGLMAVALTGSRGGMLTSIVGLLILPLTMTSISPTKMATLFLVLGISGALAIRYVPDTVTRRLASTSSDVEAGNLGGRFKLWVAGVHAFARQPFLGYGSGAFKAAITPELGANAQVAHNSYLSVLVEQGIIGFVFFMAMFVSVFRAAFKLPWLERRFMLVLLATLGIAMLPLSWDDRKSVWVILAIVLAFTQAHAMAPRPAEVGTTERYRPVRWRRVPGDVAAQPAERLEGWASRAHRSRRPAP